MSNPSEPSIAEPEDTADAEARDALTHFPVGAGAAVEPLPGGLIHRTLLVIDGDRQYVLQRVSPIFAPEIQSNIVAVSRHLRAHGLASPQLIPTVDGQPCAELWDGSRWRLLSHIAGATFERCESAAQARSAGQLVGRFHSALADFEAPLAPLGVTVHDWRAHRARLAALIDTHRGHRLQADVAALAARIAEHQDALAIPDDLPERVAHGDLKLNNVRFAGSGPDERERAIALIDLDTVSRLPLHEELGDAWRSWCNPRGEAAAASTVDLEIFAAAVDGYLEASALALTERELAALASALAHISLELSTRFAADALEESYFGWDAERFPARGEHNLARARSQLDLAADAVRKRDVMHEMVLRAARRHDRA